MAAKKTKTPKTEEKPTDESVESPDTAPAPRPDRQIATVGDLDARQRGYASGDETQQLREEIALLREGTGISTRPAPKPPKNNVPVEIQQKAGDIRQRLARGNLHLDAVLHCNLESAALGRCSMWGTAIESGVMAAITEGERLLGERERARQEKLAEAKDVVKVRITGRVLLSKLAHLRIGMHTLSTDDVALLAKWTAEITAGARARGGLGTVLGKEPGRWPVYEVVSE